MSRALDPVLWDSWSLDWGRRYMIRRILQPLRVGIIFMMILVYLATMSLLWLVMPRGWRRVLWSNRILRQFCRVGLWVLGVKVKAFDVERVLEHGNGLLVGNHLSYLDVLVISSVVPACFVTSVEIKQTPGLGLLCQMAGTLFVERRSRANLRGEINELSEGLKNDLNVAVFPEATSTNGEQILRFKRPLFSAAVEAARPVKPFCLNYHRVGGAPIDSYLRDMVFWYGDMDFLPHLWALGGSGGVEVDLHFLPLIETVGRDPADLAVEARAAVESVFRPVSPADD